MAVPIQSKGIALVGNNPSNMRWVPLAQKCHFFLQKAAYVLSQAVRSFWPLISSQPGLVQDGSFNESQTVQITVETSRHRLDLSGDLLTFLNLFLC